MLWDYLLISRFIWVREIKVNPMIYENLFEQAGGKRIRAGLIGTGTYGISLVEQSQFISRLEIPVICDQEPEAAQRAYQRAGISDEDIVICRNRKELLQALESGKSTIAENYTLLMNAPLDVIIECTGNPEAGARHAELAIKHGKHVAMVNKETDSVVGPILRKLADKAGLIYTPVDGDQHGLLIGLVSWARSIGLEIVCGGKVRPNDFVYDEAAGTVTDGLKNVALTSQEIKCLRNIQTGQTSLVIEERRKILRELPQIAEADLCESVIAANSTGLLPDTPSLHAPIIRTKEIPDVLCLNRDDGILGKWGAIDVITCLRRADEAGLGGGVFIVFSCKKNDTWNFVKAKGLLSNQRGTCGAIYRPYHLLGIEAPISILCAGLLNISTGSLRYEPQVDLIARSAHDLKAGSTIHSSHEHPNSGLEPVIVPSVSIGNGNPLPFYMAIGNRLNVDVPAGTLLTGAMIEPPLASRLWELRQAQDGVFKPKN